MEPLTLASLVGVLGVYVAERRHDESVRDEDFRDWLHRRGHNKILEAIRENVELSDQIKHTLRSNHDDLAYQLDIIERSLAAITSCLDSFSGLSDILVPENRISSQAKDLLVGLETLQATGIVKEPATIGNRGKTFSVSGTEKTYTPKEPQFIDDDLLGLVDLGLLRISEFSSGGDPVFKVTRNGSELAKKYIESVDADSIQEAKV